MGLTRQRSRTDGHSWYRTILMGTVIGSGLALLLQFVGFVSSGWIVLSAPTGLWVSAGVWYIQICAPSGDCRTASMTRVINPFNVAGDDAVDFINWQELQVELTLGFVACIACVVLSVQAFVRKSHQPTSYLLAAAGTALVSALLVLVPVTRLLHIIAHWRSYISYNTPYSLVLSALGALVLVVCILLDLISVLMVLWDIRKERERREDSNCLTMQPL